MEDEETFVAAQSHRQPAICQECKLNPSKYTCPGCSVRSCSLPCVKSHKQRTACSGKRQQTKFVPFSQFDDELLLSDYNLLEEVKRVAESAQRMRYKLCGKFPFHLQGLRRAAAQRRTKLLLLPNGLTRRAKNQSRYDQRKKSICWTIEWRFHSEDVVLMNHGVNENINLFSVIEKHLEPGPWNHKLRKFCVEQLDCLKFFIRKFPKGPRSPFHKLDIRAPLGPQLANIVILEYPVIHVFLPSHPIDFEVVQVALPHKPELKKEHVENTDPIPEGVFFREEEIEEKEEGISLDTNASDLMKKMKTDGASYAPNRESKIEENHPIPTVGDTEEMKYDFEQDLIYACSDLIVGINPDDFLDLEGVFSHEVEFKERTDSSGAFLGELEEGEIPFE